MQIPFYKRLFSWFYPVRVKRTSSTANKILDLYLFRGRTQLATMDALYSDGIAYRPLITAFKELDSKLPVLKKVLVLGTGLGSAVELLAAKECYPNFTLVDIDKTVLQLALEHLQSRTKSKITPVCADAQEYVAKNEGMYELVIVDIFNGLFVPAFVATDSFLQDCKKAILPGGNIAMNYIVHDEAKWNMMKKNFEEIFQDNNIINLGVNRILIATV